MGHPCLRDRALEIPLESISSPQVQRLIDDMIDTMVEYQGIGLAAPQVFQSLSLIVGGDPEMTSADQAAARDDEDGEAPSSGIPLTVIVNPRMDGQSDDMVEEWEGCLSIPDLHGRVPRCRRIDVSGLDRHGNPLQLQQSDMFARVLQHELDHLEGILYIDRMTDLRSLCFTAEYHRYHRP